MLSDFDSGQMAYALRSFLLHDEPLGQFVRIKFVIGLHVYK